MPIRLKLIDDINFAGDPEYFERMHRLVTLVNESKPANATEFFMRLQEHIDAEGQNDADRYKLIDKMHVATLREENPE